MEILGASMDPGNPVGEALSTRPKYVASTTLTDPQWADTTILSSDVAAAMLPEASTLGGVLPGRDRLRELLGQVLS
jgi:hypothetical protein